MLTTMSGGTLAQEPPLIQERRGRGERLPARLGSRGFDASTDDGDPWCDGIKQFPTAGTPLLSPVLLGDDHDGGGDPAINTRRDSAGR